METVADALRAHGYDCTVQAALEGRSGTVYTVPLLAERGGEAVVFDVHDGDVPDDLPRSVLEVRDDVAAQHAVLCHTGAEPAPVAGMRFWGPADLSRLFGDALLREAAGVEVAEPEVAAPPVPVAEDAPSLGGSAPSEYPRGRPALRADHPEPAPVPVAESVEEVLPGAFREPEGTLDLDVFEAMDLSALDGPAEEAGAPEPAEPVGEAAASPAARFTYPVLPVLVTHAEAREQARERLFRVTHVEMVLQPVHLLDYECDLMGKGTLRYDTVRGRVQVHGTDKAVREVDPLAVDPAGFTRLADASGFPANERTLRASDGRADANARAFLTEAHTRTVDVQVDDEEHNLSYTEKVKVRPRPDHIRLQHLGVFHRVVWRVRGPNGHIDIDALTGEDVQEALQTPDPDAVVID